MKFLILLLLICVQMTYIYSTILATPFRCFIWDSKCLTALAKNIGPGYIQRIPELSALRLDPLDIDFLQLNQDDLMFEIKDTEVHGLSNLIIDEMSVLPNVSLGRILMHTDILFTGNYKCNGSVFFQPINGEGPYSALLKNLEFEIFIPYNIVKNAVGVEFLDSSNYNYRFVVKDNAQFRLENLFNGDKERSDLMHLLLNDNWKFITAQYGRTYASRIIDSLAKAYKNYFYLMPLRSLVEF